MNPQDTPQKIEIKQVLDIRTLDARLRNVKLKGFPDVAIYKPADIEIKSFSPEQIRKDIFTPQPRVYRTFIEGINQMAEMFKKHGINMFCLTEGVDFAAHYQDGKTADWTLIPPVVETIDVGFNPEGGLDYTHAIGPELREAMERDKHQINPELALLNFPEFERFREQEGVHAIMNICDGSNRIHAALEKGLTQHLLVIDGTQPGFPYYAAPKPYRIVHVEPERTSGEGSDKTHVLTEPGHKKLYRLFPSGGILTGDVRPDKPTS